MSRRRALALLALALLCTMYLARIGGYVLQDPDEGRYAEIPREMLETGDWITPRLFYVKYFEKPPLLYWLTALSFKAFGLTEWAARLVPAVSGIVTVVLTFFLGVRLAGTRAAWLGAGVLATMPLFFALSQALLIDMLLTACMTTTMLALYAAHVAEDKRGWALVVAASVALGVLAKGLVALVLPGMIALAFFFATRDTATIRALLRWPPILLFLVVAVPWFVVVSVRNPEFFEFFFIREHFQRFLASAPGRVGHREGPFYYVPVMLFGPAPWTFVAAALAASAAGRQAFFAIPRETRLFLLLWAGIVVGFFTLSTSKLATYVLPALPALAILFGAWIDRALEDAALVRRVVGVLRGTLLVVGATMAVLALVAWPLYESIARWTRQDTHDVLHVAGVVSWTALVLLAAGGVSYLLRFEQRGRPVAAVGALTAGLALMLLCAVEGRAVTKTSRALADAIVPLRQHGDLLLSYKRLMQGLPFYTRGPVIQFDAYHEIRFGALIAPNHDELFWNDFERIEQEWSSGRRVFIATDVKHIPFLQKELDPTPRILVQDQRRVVLVNFPASASDGEAVAVETERPHQPGG
ncbi:MAG TPA: glycosyltransferase family 39 protein [Candidatus Binatia bacterium]